MTIFLGFIEKWPITGKVSKFCSQFATPIDVLCSNFVKFGRRKIGKIVRCLHDKKFCLALQLSLLRGSCPKYARASPENVLRVPQTSSKSIHFRRSNFRTREHRQSALESEFMIRLKPIALLASSRITMLLSTTVTDENLYTPCSYNPHLSITAVLGLFWGVFVSHDYRSGFTFFDLAKPPLY